MVAGATMAEDSKGVRNMVDLASSPSHAMSNTRKSHARACSAALLCLGILPLVQLGCMPTLTTLQRLEPAMQNEPAFAIGAGATMAFDPSGEQDRYLSPALDLGFRQGLAPNLDVGGRLWPLALTGTLDVKYRFLVEPFEAAIVPGLGVTLSEMSRLLPFLHLGHPFQVQAYGVLLLGFDVAGGQLIMAPKLHSFMDASGAVLLPGAMIGYDIDLGENGNFMPEINFHCTIGHEACFIAVSLGMFY